MRVFLMVKAWLFGLRDGVELVGPRRIPEDQGPAVVLATVLARSESDSALEPREADQIAVSPAGTVVEFLEARLADAESALTCRALPLPLHATSYSDPSERDVAATRSLIAGCSAIFDPAAGWESEEARRLAKRILGHLAVIYSDHPDFREEWRPSHDVPHETPGTVSLVWPLRSIDTNQ